MKPIQATPLACKLLLKDPSPIPGHAFAGFSSFLLPAWAKARQVLGLVVGETEADVASSALRNVQPVRCTVTCCPKDPKSQEHVVLFLGQRWT